MFSGRSVMLQRSLLPFGNKSVHPLHNRTSMFRCYSSPSPVKSSPKADITTGAITTQQQALSADASASSSDNSPAHGALARIDASSQMERPELLVTMDPMTFGVPHELIPGGHIPGSATHINLIQDMLEMLNDCGLPWWSAISILTITFRLAVLPLNISLIRNSARLNTVRRDLETQGAIMSNPQSTEEEKLRAAQNYSHTLKENKCHPLYNIISPLVMTPMFLSVFLAVERICLHDPTCRGSGGIWWFHDLSSMDPTFMLPVLSAATWLLTIELGAAEARTELMRSFRSTMRFTAAVMVPVTASLPSGVFVYWITSNMFSLLQIYVMQRGPVRRFFRIPHRTSLDRTESLKPITT